MRASFAVCLLAAAGCGRLGFDVTSKIDAGDNDVDGGGEFGAPMLITELSDPTTGDDDATLRADGLEIFWESGRGGGADLWTSTRATIDSTWRTPTMAGNLSSADGEDTPHLTDDGLTIYFGSNRGPGSDYNIYVSSRVDFNSSWSTPRLAEGVDTGEDEVSAVPSADNLTLFVSVRPSGTQGISTIVLFQRASVGDPWVEGRELSELNIEPFQSPSFLTADGLELYFARVVSAGNPDIFRASRATPDGVFDPAEAISEVNTGDPESDATLDGTSRIMIFTRGGGSTGELYEARR